MDNYILLSSKKHENIRMLSTGTSLLKWVQLNMFVRCKTFVCLKIHMHEIFIVFFNTFFGIFQSLIDTKHSTSTFSKSSYNLPRYSKFSITLWRLPTPLVRGQTSTATYLVIQHHCTLCTALVYKPLCIQQ